MDWQELIKPSNTVLICGRRGSGKTALAFYLAEQLSNQLSPIICNFPIEKSYLLPESFYITTLEEALNYQDAIILCDEGTTLMPAGSKLDEMVKNFMALSRQRNQAIIFIFHSSRDVGSKILRGIDVILAKRPSRRQIEQGSKDNWFKNFLTEAKQKFQEVGPDWRKYAYIDAEDVDERLFITNELPSFWSDELSVAWGSVSSISTKDSQIKISNPAISKDQIKEIFEFKRRTCLLLKDGKIIDLPRQD